ncbi:MAG: hypothetical protein IKF01_03765 [Bacilli bacterium]|nr:hypothetical protein [Bacilli bacterium]
MENKVLIKLIVPALDKDFDIFIPVNEVVWKIKKMLIKSVMDITDTNLNVNSYYILINKENGNIYNDNQIIIDTDIRNISELMLIEE